MAQIHRFSAKVIWTGAAQGSTSAYESYSRDHLIEVNVNGAAQRFEPDTDIAALLERLQLAGKRVAVERNGEIVPRSRFAQTALANGDRLEIVVAVGGG